MTVPEEGGFGFVTGDDCIGIDEQAVRLEKEAKELTPFPAGSGGFVEGALERGGEVEGAAMDADDERQAATFGRGKGYATQPAKGVGVNHVDFGFSPEGGQEVEGEQVAADGEKLATTLRGDAPDGHKGAKTGDAVTGSLEGVGQGGVLQSRAVNRAAYPLFCEGVETFRCMAISVPPQAEGSHLRNT